MNDLRNALSVAAGVKETPPPVVEEDVRRGHRALRRRLAARVAGTVGVAVVAVGLFSGSVFSPPPSDDAGIAQSGGEPTARAPRDEANSNDGKVLVSYTGAQPEGYRVRFVPDGWEIQGANAFRLTIAERGDPDDHPDSFEGKLVVLLESADASGRPPGEKVTVAGNGGYLNRAQETVSLTFDDDAGHRVVVQVPPSLAWSDRQIIDFASGVVVTAEAVESRG